MKVNNTPDTRDRILFLLYRASGQTLSGTAIAEQTGISRVAVWKHIQALMAAGLAIESSSSGYVLAQDLLLPFCFPEAFQDRIFFFPELDSTMDKAKALAREGAPHLSCCVAEHQTRGRGRLNRQWVSDRGGLWFTLILKPDQPPPMAYIYNFAASLTLAQVLSRLFGLDIKVKWPNDLLLEGKKLTGLLSEMETQSDLIRFLTIGIGINVNNDPSKESFAATSLKNILGYSVSRSLILGEFLKAFEALTAEIQIPSIMAQWKACAATLGQQVRVQTHNRVTQGRAVDVEDSGALILETPDGAHCRIIYGDCFHT